MGKLKNILGGALSRLRGLFPLGNKPQAQPELETPQKETFNGENSLILKPLKEECPEIPAQEGPIHAENTSEIIAEQVKPLIREHIGAIEIGNQSIGAIGHPAETPEELAQEKESTEEDVRKEEKNTLPSEGHPKRSYLKQYSKPRKRWTFNGKSLTLEEWAQEYGVGKSTMRYRLDTYNNPEMPVKGELIEFRGESHTVAEWATIYGVTVGTMRYRLAKWQQPELPKECAQATLTTEPLIENTSDITIIERDGKKVIIKDGVEYSIWQFAKESGIKFSTLRGRILKSTDPQKVFAGLKYVGGRERRHCVVQGKIWVFEGEGHTVAEWAEICGISKAMMRVRLNASGNPWQNDIKKSEYNERRTKKYLCEGNLLSIKQLCERYSRSESAIRARIKKHGSPEPPKALNEVPCAAHKQPSEQGKLEKVIGGGSTTELYEDTQTVNEIVQSGGIEEESDSEYELTDELQELIRPLRLDFPIDLSKYSERGHSDAFNAFVRDIRKIMNSPDDGMPLSRIIGYGN